VISEPIEVGSFFNAYLGLTPQANLWTPPAAAGVQNPVRSTKLSVLKTGFAVVVGFALYLLGLGFFVFLCATLCPLWFKVLGFAEFLSSPQSVNKTT
jgi:hypothetical protein